MNEHGAESVLREFLPIYSLFTRKYMLGTFLSIHENMLQKEGEKCTLPGEAVIDQEAKGLSRGSIVSNARNSVQER